MLFTFVLVYHHFIVFISLWKGKRHFIETERMLLGDTVVKLFVGCILKAVTERNRTIGCFLTNLKVLKS